MEDADILQVPVALGKIEPVSDHEFVRNGEADVVALYRLQTARGLVQQRSQAQRFWTALSKYAQEIVGRESGIEDILDQDHIQSGDVVVQILEHAHLPGGFFGLAIAPDGNKINGGFQIDFTGKIGEKKTGTLKDANQVNAL